MNQLDEFLEKADLPQEEPQPLTKPLVCPKCGCKEVEEATNGNRFRVFLWDEKREGYEEYHEALIGERWLQCGICGYKYPIENLKQFDASNPAYKYCVR